MFLSAPPTTINIIERNFSTLFSFSAFIQLLPAEWAAFNINVSILNQFSKLLQMVVLL
jgi:hypothetical protein